MVATFAQLSGPPPPDLPPSDLPHVSAMFLRIASLSGASAPVLRLSADTGVAVVLSANAQPVFSRPGQEGLIADATMDSQANGAYAVTVAMFDSSSHVWTLGIENTDRHDDYEFTWVVADNRGETSHPWVAPGFTSATSFAVDEDIFSESFTPVNVCVASTTQTVYFAAMNHSLRKKTQTGLSTIAAPGGIFALAFDPVRDALWITQAAGQSMSVVEGDQVVATVTAGAAGGANPQFSRLAIDSVARRVYMTNSAQNVVAIIDADTRQVASLIPTGSGPADVAVDPTSDTAYVANAKSNDITVIRNGSAAGSLPALPTAHDIPNRIVVAPGGGALFVGSGVGPHVATVDPQAGTTAPVPAVVDPLHSDFTADIAVDSERYLGYVFLGSQGVQSSPLFLFDTRRSAPLTSLGTSTQAFACAEVDPTTGLLYAGFGATQSFSTGLLVFKTTTSPAVIPA